MMRHLECITEAAQRVTERRSVMKGIYKEKIESRFNEWIAGADPLVQGRCAQEVALLIDRSDITEEMIRLEHHIARFKEFLSTEERAVGKKLDFLAQEMHREMSTLGAKSADILISDSVIEMKSALEKIREQ